MEQQGYRKPQEAQNKNTRRKLRTKPQRNKIMGQFADFVYCIIQKGTTDGAKAHEIAVLRN